ncbi:MAG: Trk system potassium transporter TrkA [Eubacteriales bacterium]|nr:Trk system potassium transporter TrkA [Eubacteriales bacterium]MDD3883062.1 Trk system potassium transporter TrkA [Eubacteriales bacterium]MDD4513613.1 Trk system potassium transporter TrkA [Eubacteriales bacterium]
MKIVVIGDGKVGYTITQALSAEGHDLVVIDNRKEALSLAEEQLDVIVMEGNGASTAVQKLAGVGESDLMIAVTNADELNLMCCIVAKKLGCKHTIARIRNPEYADELYLLRDELGLSMTVNPERSAAHEIFRLLQFPSFLKRDVFAKGRGEIVCLPVRSGSKLDGMVLQQLYTTLKIRVLVCAVERGSDIFIPAGDFTLLAGDHIYVTATTYDLVSLVKRMELETAKIRSVMIIGGSHIAYYLSQMLDKAGIRVKLIEQNMEKCRKLSETLPNTTIIHADGTSFSTLMSEGLNEEDAIVTLTNMDEQNLIISVYANHIHVPKVITKINRVEYGEILHDAGAECTISPRLLTSNNILRFVRAMENRYDESVITLHRMVNERVEAVEFRTTSATRYLGVPLKDIPLKKNLRIALITHQNGVIVPRGSDCFYEGDMVVVVTLAENRLTNLNDIFIPTSQGGAEA